MRRLKYTLVLIITVAVIAAGAMLPAISAKLQDAAVRGKVSYGDMEAMHLDLHELSTLEKLYLADRGSIVDISESKTQLKRENIRQIAEAKLQPYIQHNLIPDNLADLSFECQPPKLYYIVDTVDISNIFWLVTLYSIDEDWSRIELCIDDKTGKIITITYDCEQPVYEEWFLETRLTDFYTIYFNRLGLDPMEGSFTEDINGTKHVIFNWGDIEYGEILMQFNIYSNGFYNWVFDPEWKDQTF